MMEARAAAERATLIQGWPGQPPPPAQAQVPFGAVGHLAVPQPGAPNFMQSGPATNPPAEAPAAPEAAPAPPIQRKTESFREHGLAFGSARCASSRLASARRSSCCSRRLCGVVIGRSSDTQASWARPTARCGVFA